MDVLDAATKEVAERKGAALTPVGLERPSTDVKVDMFNGRMPDMPTIFMPQEAIEMAVREIRAQAKALLAACAAIDASLGKPDIGESRTESLRVAVDTAKSFDEDYAAKSEAAQAAAFAPVVPAPSGWVCPSHGDSTLETLTSRKGRVYLACTSCEEFQP